MLLFIRVYIFMVSVLHIFENEQPGCEKADMLSME